MLHTSIVQRDSEMFFQTGDRKMDSWIGFDGFCVSAEAANPNSALYRPKEDLPPKAHLISELIWQSFMHVLRVWGCSCGCWKLGTCPQVAKLMAVF